MLPKTILAISLAVLAEARFGQEQLPIQAIQDVQGSDAGEASTIAGAAISDVLAGSSSCDKLSRADEIISKLGTGDDAMAAAIGMVAAEKNFNPFTQDLPTICNDPTLPKTKALRGITPLIDPDVGGADVANALSEKTKANPLDATGMSVADLLSQNGFSNFTGEDAAGNKDAASGGGGDASTSTASTGSANSNASSGSSSAASPAASASTAADVNQSGSSSQSAASSSQSSSSSSSSSSSLSGADFGKCTPTMKFVGGLNGRPADEFTFIPTDDLVAEGQQEALNPNIITNRICDQLTNVCDANDAAKSACEDAKTQIEDLGTKDQSTADKWNELLGFGGAAKRDNVVVRRAGKMEKREMVKAVHREVMDWAKVRA